MASPGLESMSMVRSATTNLDLGAKVIGADARRKSLALPAPRKIRQTISPPKCPTQQAAVPVHTPLQAAIIPQLHPAQHHLRRHLAKNHLLSSPIVKRSKRSHLDSIPSLSHNAFLLQQTRHQIRRQGTSNTKSYPKRFWRRSS